MDEDWVSNSEDVIKNWRKYMKRKRKNVGDDNFNDYIAYI